MRNFLKKLESKFDCCDYIDLLKIYVTENVSYWNRFGYIYFGLIFFKNMDLTLFLEEDLIENKSFFKKIIQLMNFNYNKLETCRYIQKEEIELNIEIQKNIRDGIKKFSFDFKGYTLEEVVCADVCKFTIKYLIDNLSKNDEYNILEAKYYREYEEFNALLPITPREKISFAVGYPWPGGESAELEFIYRIREASKNIDFDFYLISDYGKILKNDSKETDEFIDPSNIDFVISTHYETHKTVDAFYYHTLWNPPEIPLNLDYYEGKIVDNYVMNDDFLIYDDGGMKNHLESILIDSPRNLEQTSMLVSSFPKNKILTPNLNNPKIFYCGMNWEKVVSNSNRHEGLFKLLDKTKCVKFYGPEKVSAWGGIRPWEGYECYQYSIPFDGFSILDEINSCGICLSISSDIHRRAGAVTNRTYEACAAGAIIISDDNPFMKEKFGDSVLYIEYNIKKPEDTFEQIMEKYNWIMNNKDEALIMAKKSQKIFLEEFLLEDQLINMAKNHHNRFTAVKENLFSKEENNTVLVTHIISSENEQDIIEELKIVTNNIENQIYNNITFVVVCDETVEQYVKNFIDSSSIDINLQVFKIYNDKGTKILTDSRIIKEIQKLIPHIYYINISSVEKWFYDHITTLVRALEDDCEALISYSGRLSMDNIGYKRTDFFNTLDFNTIYYQEHPKNMPIPGQFLFSKKCEEFIPSYTFDYIDGLEHAEYINLLNLKYRKKMCFSKRMTCVYNFSQKDNRYKIIDYHKQIRFIRGLVKYDLYNASYMSSQTNINDIYLEDKLLNFPIKSWFMQRIYKVFLRRFSKNILKERHEKYKKMFRDNF